MKNELWSIGSYALRMNRQFPHQWNKPKRPSMSHVLTTSDSLSEMFNWIYDSKLKTANLTPWPASGCSEFSSFCQIAFFFRLKSGKVNSGAKPRQEIRQYLENLKTKCSLPHRLLSKWDKIQSFPKSSTERKCTPQHLQWKQYPAHRPVAAVYGL